MELGHRRVALYGPGTLAVAALVYAGWFRGTTADADTLAGCADVEMRMGLFETASRNASAALEADPRHLQALLIDAHCKSRLEDWEHARDRYRQALALVTDPDLTTEIRVALAMIARERRAWQEGEDTLALASPRSPELAAKVAYASGVLHEAHGAQDAAIHRFRDVAIHPASPAPLKLEACERLAANGCAEEARVYLDRLAPSDPAALYLRAKLKLEAWESDKAAQDLEHLAAISRETLAAGLKADAEFWERMQQRGFSLPAIRSLEWPPRGGTAKQGGRR